jgi:hypothetical protein
MIILMARSIPRRMLLASRDIRPRMFLGRSRRRVMRTIGGMRRRGGGIDRAGGDDLAVNNGV